MNYRHWLISFGIIVFAGLAALSYGEYRLNKKLTAIQSRLASTTELFGQEITLLRENLAEVAKENTSLQGHLEEQSAAFQEQFGKVSATVKTLDKLSKTDPELLQKYSKVYFLNEHYAPDQLTDIGKSYLFDPNKKLQIESRVWPYLEKLLKAAKADGLDLQIISAYRSFGTQSSLKGAYTVIYGAGTANQFSADQGYSEHQLGTAVDFTNPTVADTFSGFAKSSEYKWLTKNAYKYGFILSYPENNKYYEFEPWHWRFVGVDLATRLQREGKYFYDLDQRVIDHYLALIFD